MKNSVADVFPAHLLEALAARRGAPAFEHGDRVVSGDELLDLIGQFAAGLRTAGLGPGAGVAVSTAVGPEGFAAQIAAHTLGCRVVGVPPRLPHEQLSHILADVDAVLADDSTAAVPAGSTTVLRVGPELLGGPETPVAQGKPDDTATVVYTSGSTGTPKGAEFSSAAMAARWSWRPPANLSAEVAAFSERYERFLLFGTLASAVMQEHLGLCLLSGGTVVIPDGPPVFPDILAELRISAALLTVPRFYHLLDLLAERRVDLSAARALLVAGSPLAPHRLERGYDLLGDALCQGYGQTETGMLTLQTARDVRAMPETLASVGRPWADAELQVRDESGNEVSAGETGEIWARTPSLLTAYRYDADETADVLHAGWVRTRDVGHFDERGFLYLTGRSREVIIVNAVLHYPGPIERALAAHPGVDQAYVVGAPDERTGEAVHAFIVPAARGALDFAALRALVTEKAGESAVPATITVVDSVPVAPSGKPDKRALLASLSLG